ncbi:MAG: hypothetical protein ABSG83_05390 [Roseiarcus sp.]|jgi:hypothetical protein
MAFPHRGFRAAALTLAIGAMLTSGAQAQQVQPHRHHWTAHPHVAARDREVPPVRPGDVVVRTGRSYLDPGPSANVGTEDRYFYDTAHFDLRSEGPDFTRNSGGFELLPRPFDSPGRQESLFDFN